MASSVVFKVKYEDTLRRFNALVNEDQQLDLDMEALRAKISSLFNFTADADLKLTYVDEDLDIVALVDEEDLRDVVRQGLNPVRITVQLNTRKLGSSTARSSGTSTPLRPQGHSSPNINAGVADILKSVPEPLHEAISKLSAEAASKAASSSLVLADLIESITKVSQSFLNANHPPKYGPADVAASKEAGEKCNESSIGKDAVASQDGRVKHDGAAPASNWIEVQGHDDFTRLVDESASPKDIITKRKLDSSVNTAPLGAYEEGCSSGKGITDYTVPKVNKNQFPHSVEENSTKNPNKCPFRGPPVPPPMSSLFPSVPQVRSSFPVDGFGTQGAIFHRGVRCDGCGVLPITGPRFKSKVKEDYDLCRICFSQMGNEADYIRIDFPAPFRHPFKGNPIMNSRPWAHLPPPVFPHSGKHIKQFRPRLDSRFIMDVNVMDGTIMAPKTSFTKIWRIRNNGNLPWTHGTQLVWIGGDKFSHTDSVEIEVPVAGLYSEDEVDVAVDFAAPELPGRYISYWKMASPSGQKFGQRVWVLIQVDASLTDVPSAVTSSLNLNLPPEGPGENMDVEPLVDLKYEPSHATKMQKPLADSQENKLKDMNFPDDLLYGSFPFNCASSSSTLQPSAPTSEPISASQATCSSVSYPTIEPDLVAPAPAPASGAAKMPIFDVPVESGRATPPQVDVLRNTEVVNNDVEEALLKELEEMGFKQVKMNKEILRKNDYNLERSLDELCGFTEWDLLLEELQGMGFVDREMNKKVLAKNNGSLKHAVMDLITGKNA